MHGRAVTIAAYLGAATLAAMLLAFLALIVLGSLRTRWEGAGLGWVLVDGSGQRIGSQLFEDARPFAHGLAPVKQDGSWGYVDRSGAMVIEPAFRKARGFDAAGTAFVRRGGRWGLIDREGAIVLEPILEGAAPFSGGVAAAPRSLGIKRVDPGMSEDELFLSVGLLQPDGFWRRRPAERSDPGRWVSAKGPVDGLIAAQLVDRKWGLFDLEGRPVVAARFSQLGVPGEGRVPARRDGAWGYIDTEGAWVIPPKWRMARPFHDGVAIVRGNGASYLIGQDGGRIAGPFEGLRSHSEGRLAAREGGRWGFIDSSGSWVIEPGFDDVGVEGFEDGYARVQRRARAGRMQWAWIDASGEVLGDLWAAGLTARSEGLGWARVSGRAEGPR